MGEYRISVDDCAAPLDSGASCSAGDLCPPGEACIGGTCEDAPTYGEECNTGEMLFDDGEFVGYGYTTPDTPCAYDFANESPLFCANQATPEQHRQAFEDLVNGNVVRSTTIHRYCVRYRGIGETCADSADIDNLKDLCEPGLVCDNAVCKRPCSTSSQCPCDDGVPAYGCDAAAGFCEYEHTELFTSCTTNVGERCAAPLVCSLYHDIEGEARSWGRCGFDLGEPCETNSECAFSSEPPVGFGPPRECVDGECALAPRALGESCQDSFGTINPNAYHDDWCASGTTCDRVSGTCLGTLGSPCADNDDCINDLECGSSSTCAPACRSGECNVSGLRGDCARGFRDCSVGPECAQVTFPSEEVCDGIDNDCNGSTDDDVPEVGMDCTGPEDAGTFNCQSGFMVPGKTVCESGEVKCRASLCNPNDVDATGCLCIAAAAASTGDPSKFGLPCGSPSNTPCEPTTRCTPSSACVSDFGAQEICKVQTGVGMCPFGTPKCWTPADVQPGLNCYGAE